MNHLEAFGKFCEIYPFRNGRRIRIKEARCKFFKLKVKDLELIIKATENYRNDKDVKAGIGIRDAHRYIKDGKGIEIWREYIQPEKPQRPPEPDYSPPKRTGKTLTFREVARRLMEDIKKRKSNKK